MNRRGFVGRMIGAVVAVKIAPKTIDTPATDTIGSTYHYKMTYVTATEDRANLLRFYALTAKDPNINQREFLRRIEAVMP